jgi:hemolysin activation/secretion protein
LGETVDIEKELRYSALELHTQWQQRSSKRIIQLNAGVKQGLEIGSNRNQLTDANGTRSGTESVHFTAFNVDGAWRYLLHPRWKLQSRANIFWSDDILPSAEQVRYGDKRFGRGYPDGQAQGDRGYAAEIELRYLQLLGFELIKRMEPYLVIDAARTKLRANSNEQELSSAAIGVDITDSQYYSVGLEYAKAMGDPHFKTGDRDPIYNIRLRWQF